MYCRPDTPSPEYFISYKDILPHNHSTITKIRMLELMNNYLILRFCSCFAKCPNVFKRKRSSCLIVLFIYIFSSFIQPYLYFFSLLHPGTFPQSFLDFQDLKTIRDYSQLLCRSSSMQIYLLFSCDWIQIKHLWQDYHIHDVMVFTLHLSGCAQFQFVPLPEVFTLITRLRWCLLSYYNDSFCLCY